MLFSGEHSSHHLLFLINYENLVASNNRPIAASYSQSKFMISSSFFLMSNFSKTVSSLGFNMHINNSVSLISKYTAKTIYQCYIA
jgi:hypothetical protein